MSAEKSGQKFKDSITVEGKKLVLNGLGVRLASFFNVEVYIGALYLGKRTSDPKAVLSSTLPKKMIMTFVRDVERGKIVDAWELSIKINFKDPDKYKKSFEEFKKGLTAMKEGESLVITLLEKGVKLKSTSGKEVFVKDPGFSRNLPLVWVGEKPPNKEVKTGVLGL
jgi:hypothetical protein